jgi:hypothetical protein
MNSSPVASMGIGSLRTIVNQQSEDDGLWFRTRTAPEAYLQQELRKLHFAIESLDNMVNRSDR